MALATAELEQQHTFLQFGPDVVWSEWIVPVSESRRSDVVQPGVRAMYARLASEYEAEPAVPDRGGGVPGDRFPL